MKGYTEIRLSDLKGFKVGHAQNTEGGSGCTAIICPEGAVAGVDVRGGGPASRETELLKPINMVQKIHCVMLSGGSAYGLAAGDGAMAYLEEQGIGFDVTVGVVPIVCGASLFDLICGDPKCRPDKAMGYEACKNAEKGDPEEGNVGAGTGATVGKFQGLERAMKSGLGIYAVQAGDVQCAAVVAVNALGDVLDYDTGKPIAGMMNEEKTEVASTAEAMIEDIGRKKDLYGKNTTLGCILTNAKLTKAQCTKLAGIAHNGYARTISPVHTSNDGDSIFVMAHGEAEVDPDALGVLAAEVMARAIDRAVRQAKTAYGFLSAGDLEAKLI